MGRIQVELYMSLEVLIPFLRLFIINHTLALIMAILSHLLPQ